MDDLTSLQILLFLGCLLGFLSLVLYLAGALDAELFSRRLLRRLGLRGKTLALQTTLDIPRTDLPDHFLGLQALLKSKGYELKVEGIYGARNPAGIPLEIFNLAAFMSGLALARFGPPLTQSFPVGPAEFCPVPVDSLITATGGPFPLLALFRPHAYMDAQFQLFMSVQNSVAAVAWLEELKRELADWIQTNSCFRGKMLRPRFQDRLVVEAIDFEPLQPERAPNLPEAVLRQLEESFLSFKLHETRLMQEGVSCQRGLLLCGSPGTGKTSTIHYLKERLPDHTFLSVPLRSLNCVEGVFRLARRFPPAVLVLDDIDLFAQEREANPFKELLGELMSQMDGLTPRERVDVVMTSNTWSGIEKALSLRPGRIDHVILYETPDRAQRERILARYLGSQEDPDLLHSLTEMSEGSSPAQLKELVARGRAMAALRSPSEPILATLAEYRRAYQGIQDNPLVQRVKRPSGMQRGSAPLSMLRPPNRPEAEGSDHSPEDPERA